MNTARLLEIVKELKFEDLQAELEGIISRQESHDCQLVLPLVGEFSSGKTSLINAITDSKALETATAPTTSTIYEINFSAEQCAAVVTDSEGNRKVYEDISSVTNEAVADSQVVQIFDTSTKVPSSVVLVDTPGISSINPKHQLSLVNFLPNADGVILVADIEQQLKKSLVDFVKEMRLDAKPLYLVLTKCDLKSQGSVAAVVSEIESNKNLPIRKVACVSASRDDVSQFIEMIRFIQDDKASILGSVSSLREKAISDEVRRRVKVLLDASSDDDALADAVEAQKERRKSLEKAINSLSEEIEDEINAVKDRCFSSFKISVSERLNSLVMSGNADYDRDVVTIVNTSAASAINKYREDIRPIITSAARSTLSREGISLCALDQIELTDCNIGALPYVVNLGAVGHVHDKKIASAIKLAAAMAVAYAVGQADENLDIQVGDGGLSAGDVLTPASVSASTVSKAYRFITRTQEEYATVEGYDSSTGAQLGMQKGLVETAVGFASDRLAGKPQRMKAIADYLDNMLLPKFRIEIESLTKKILSQVSAVIYEAAGDTLNEISETLADMQRTLKESDANYAKKIAALKTYHKELTTI